MQIIIEHKGLHFPNNVIFHNEITLPLLINKIVSESTIFKKFNYKIISDNLDTNLYIEEKGILHIYESVIILNDSLPLEIYDIFAYSNKFSMRKYKLQKIEIFL